MLFFPLFLAPHPGVKESSYGELHGQSATSLEAISVAKRRICWISASANTELGLGRVITKKTQFTYSSSYTEHKCLCEFLLSARSYPGSSQSRTFNSLMLFCFPRVIQTQEKNKYRAIHVVPATDFLGPNSLTATALVPNHTTVCPHMTQSGWQPGAPASGSMSWYRTQDLSRFGWAAADDLLEFIHVSSMRRQCHAAPVKCQLLIE